jgi:hypothetical protein
MAARYEVVRMAWEEFVATGRSLVVQAFPQDLLLRRCDFSSTAKFEGLCPFVWAMRFNWPGVPLSGEYARDG